MTDIFQQKYTQEEFIHRMTVDLVMLVHLAMDWDIWGKKRLKYWDIFSDNISTAAYTDKLSRWLDKICAQMQVPHVGRNHEERCALHGIITSGHDKEVLRHLREEINYVVTEVQVSRQDAREAFNEKNTTTLNNKRSSAQRTLFQLENKNENEE